jgi:hypothetical protein
VSRLTTAKRRALRHGLVRRARAGRELVRLVRTLSRSVLFDRALYEAQRGRRFRGDAAAAYDWVVEGSRLGLVAGPLLIPTVDPEGRRPGVGPASWWASQLRAAGFPRTTAHPLADVGWYAAEVPGSASWRGGPLAHYAEVGRREGARLGPLDPGGTDLVKLGRAVLSGRPGSREPGPGPVGAMRSAVVLATGSSRTPLHVLPALLAEGARVDEVLVVEGAAPTPELRLASAALGLLTPRVRVVAAAGGAAEAVVSALRRASGTDVLVVTTPVVTTPDDVRRVLEALAEPGVAAAQPVVLAPDDTVAAAGLEEVDGVLRPALAGHPWADAVRGGDRAVAAASGEVAALRRDLALDAGATPLHAATAAAALTELTRRVAGATVVVASATAGLVSRPAPRPVTTPPGVATGVPRPAHADPAYDAPLRWAIKSPHPAGPRRRTWGDFHFATALAAALERLGHEVAIDPLDSWYRPTAVEDHVTLTLRGLHRHRPSPHQVNLLWVISHPELVTDGEIDEVDATFAASISWSRARTAAGHRVEPLLQCTDAAIFTPEAGVPGTGHPLLFVGNSRSARRPIVEAAIETGRDLTIIGGGWSGRVPPETVRSEYAENAALPALYRCAEVVLNDHWPQMAAEGFLSNRLFDLTAAGARWVSDPARDLAEVFPNGRVASDPAALESLLAGRPDTFPTEDELREASRRVRAEHSFDARARALSEAVRRLRADAVVRGTGAG